MIGFLLLWFISLKGASAGVDPIWSTRGELWPLPQEHVESHGSYIIEADRFRFRNTGFNCDILERAYRRYFDILFPNYMNMFSEERILNETNITTTSYQTLDVEVSGHCEDMPHPAMEEKYKLMICIDGNTTKASLSSETIWGALKGLETFSQLALKTNHPENLEVKCAYINDYPRFPHRGILLDSSRHFLPIDVIKQNLDLMSMNKFNVFHWHIVDDHSFPYESEVYQNLTLGAWSPNHIYTRNQIKDIISYARDRGIRVIPEFDSPGHTQSWGRGQPGLLSKCYKHGKATNAFGPIDPSKEANYEFLENLFSEIVALFPDPHIHFGGDEVDFSCWERNPDIQLFMAQNNMTGDTYKLLNYYFTRLQSIFSDLPSIKGYHVWQEVFDNNVKLHWNTIINVWKYPGSPQRYYPEMTKVTSAGYRVILSACWYLNYIKYGEDWKKFYNCDPHNFYGTYLQRELVIGGEACLWGEYLDEANLIATAWPRASAVAEKLWSPRFKTGDADSAKSRLLEHRCRMLKRGYSVQTIGPSFCQID